MGGEVVPGGFDMQARTLAALIGLVVLQGCGPGGGQSFIAPRAVTVRWSPAPETAVNQPGGGYRVYYSRDPEFVPSGTPAAVVAYPASTHPSATLSLMVGTYYIRVVAYSALPVPGGGSAVSQPSAPVAVQVP